MKYEMSWVGTPVTNWDIHLTYSNIPEVKLSSHNSRKLNIESDFWRTFIIYGM